MMVKSSFSSKAPLPHQTISYLQPSEEQCHIIEQIQQGKNVIIDAIAGSGKSTTILCIANALPNKRILQITYNSMLRKEFREKVQMYQIANIESHTYHSLAVKYFSPHAFTDTGIRQFMYHQGKEESKGSPESSDGDLIIPMSTHISPVIPSYDIIMLDECQDMTPLYYQFIKWVLLTTQRKQSIQLVFLGDYMQGIYDFKGADIRFLTMAESLWKGFSIVRNPYDFVYCELKTSYRITNQMCHFVNHVMLNSSRLTAKRNGKPVQYIRREYHNLIKILVYQIQQIIEKGDLPSDILVLAASFKGSLGIGKRVENALVSHGIPCYLPLMESDKLDERVIDGKVVFSTFHTVKGRQRKHVFVLGFDNSYFARFGRNIPRDECPNTLYVAATRATHTLYLLESNNFSHDRPLEFLGMNHHQMKTCEFIEFKGHAQTLYEVTSTTRHHSNGNEKHIFISATDLVRFIPEHTLESLLPLLHKVFRRSVRSGQALLGFTKDIPSEWTPPDIPNVVGFENGLFEDVSEVNGIAIPSMYYDWIKHDWMKQLQHPHDVSSERHTMSCPILISLIFEIISDMNVQEHRFLKRQLLEFLQEKVNEGSAELFIHGNNNNTQYKIDGHIEELLDNKQELLQLKESLFFRKQTISDYLYITNLYVSFQEKLYYKLHQIQRHEYHWLSEETIQQCMQNIHSTVSLEGGGEMCEHVDKIKYERVLIRPTMEYEHLSLDKILHQYLTSDILELGKFRFSARVDLDNGHTLWELKCCSSFSMEHMFQLIFYAWIHEHVYDMQREYKMYNIKTNEVLQLMATKEELNILICGLIQGKYGNTERLQDDEFLAKLQSDTDRLLYGIS